MLNFVNKFNVKSSVLFLFVLFLFRICVAVWHFIIFVTFWNFLILVSYLLECTICQVLLDLVLHTLLIRFYLRELLPGMICLVFYTFFLHSSNLFPSFSCRTASYCKNVYHIFPLSVHNKCQQRMSDKHPLPCGVSNKNCTKPSSLIS